MTIATNAIEKAARWIAQDATDDFYPDVVGYLDLHLLSRNPDFIRGYRSGEPSVSISVPKSALLQRETTWLPPAARILYLAALSTVIEEIAPRQQSNSYAYKAELGGGQQYPFRARTDSWLEFRTDFRANLSSSTRAWGVVTDISAFFEHIQPTRLTTELSNYCEAAKAPIFSELREILEWGSTSERIGIPQNSDASSFFANAYLYTIDDWALRHQEARITRFSDDFRIVAKSRGAALRTLGELQTRLRQLGLFLNSAKTELVEPQSVQWQKHVAADTDTLLKQIEDLVKQGSKAEHTAFKIAEQLTDQAKGTNDERLLRAVLRRIGRVNRSSKLAANVQQMTTQSALWGFDTNPGKAADWSRFLGENISASVEHELVQRWHDEDRNTHPWISFWITKTLAQQQTPGGEAESHFVELLDRKSSASPFERSWAIVGLAKTGNRRQCSEIVGQHLNSTQPSPIRRACVLAASNLGTSGEQHIKQGAKLDACTQSLVQYMSQAEKRAQVLKPTPMRPGTARYSVATHLQRIAFRASTRSRPRYQDE